MRFSPPVTCPPPFRGWVASAARRKGRLRHGPLCGPGSKGSGRHRAPPRAAWIRPGNGFRPLSESDAQPAAGRRPQPSGCSPVNPHTEGVSKGKKQKCHRPPIGGQDSDGVSNRCSALYTLCLFEAFHPQGSVSLDSWVASLPYKSSSLATSRGNEKYGKEKQRVIYFMYHSAVFFPPFGGKRSEPITRMRIMPYDL